jgi:hypothetical protein
MPDPAQVKVVQEWPCPKNCFEFRRLADFFRKYIKGFAAIAAPLTAMLKGLDKQEKEGKLHT